MASNVTEIASTEKTHYRKAFNSPYLSAADIVGPTPLTIERVVLEKDKTKKTQDFFNTAYFAEKEIRPGERLKPMILNVHNSQVMKAMCDSPFIDDWSGLVTVYVDHNVRFGRDTVEGLRLSPGSDAISPEDADALAALIEEVGADLDKFCRHYQVAELAQLPAGKLASARAALERKRAK